MPINEIAERWIGKFERPRLEALSDLKKSLERKRGKQALSATRDGHGPVLIRLSTIRTTNQNGVEMMAGSTFAYVTFIRTSPEDLWSALTNPEFMKKYWFGVYAETDWKVGSPWKLMFPDGRIADTGEVLEIDSPKRLVLQWRNEFKPELKAEGYSRCVFEIEPVGGAVRLTITHSMDRDNAKFIDAVSGGWPRIISNLKSLLETGEVVLTARDI